MNTIFKILKFIIDSRLLISLAAVALTISTFRILDFGYVWEVFVVVFLTTWSAYTFPLVLELKSELKKLGCFCVYLLVGVIICLLLSHSHNYVSWLICLFLLISTLLYYVPIGHYRNIREVPYLKIFFIAFSWSMCTVVFPIAFVGHSTFSIFGIGLFFERFLFLFAITIPFDVRDLKPDRAGGLKTIPSRLGIRQSLLLSTFLLLLYVAVSILNYGFSNIVFVRAVCVLFVLILIQRINLSRPTYYYSGLIDGSMIFQSLLIHLMI